jgi:hypothetical protein
VGVGGEWRKVEESEARGSEGKAARLPKIGPSEQQRPWPANQKTWKKEGKNPLSSQHQQCTTGKLQSKSVRGPAPRSQLLNFLGFGRGQATAATPARGYPAPRQHSHLLDSLKAFQCQPIAIDDPPSSSPGIPAVSSLESRPSPLISNTRQHQKTPHNTTQRPAYPRPRPFPLPGPSLSAPCHRPDDLATKRTVGLCKRASVQSIQSCTGS